jgi:hypothetical protein
MTLYATVPTNRPRLTWQDHIGSVKSYKAILSTGMAFTLFSDFPTEEEFKEYLKSKESNIVTD